MKRRLLLTLLFIFYSSYANAVIVNVPEGPTKGHVRIAINNNFSALSAQDATIWLSGKQYTANNQMVVYGGNLYICQTNHTAGTFATDLGAGRWKLWGADIYSPLAVSTVRTTAGGGSTTAPPSEAAVGDALAGKQNTLTNPVVQANLGTGVYTFLGTPTAANFFTAVIGEGDFAATLFSYADAAAVLAGIGAQAADADLAYLAGLTPTANVKSILNAADYAAIKALLFSTGGIEIPATASGPQYVQLMEDTDNGTNYAGWASPGSVTNSQFFSMPATTPVVGNLLTFGTGASEAMGDGSTKTVIPIIEKAIPYELPATLISPADADDPLIDKVKRATTLTGYDCVAIGGGTISVDIQECDADGANCATTGATTAACGATNTNDATLTDTAIASGAWLKMVVGAPSGTVSQVAIKLYGTQTW